MEKPRNLNKIIESAPFEKYGLKFVGIGSENVCFEVAGSTKKVIKVSTQILKVKILKLLNDPSLKDIPLSILDQEEGLLLES